MSDDKITVPTAPSDKAPFFLDSEYQEPGALFGTRRYVATIATVDGGRVWTAAKVMHDDEAEARRRASVACHALNAAEMASGQLVDAAGDPVELCADGDDAFAVFVLDGESLRVPMTRATAADLGLALVEFAATGRLPREGS